MYIMEQLLSGALLATKAESFRVLSQAALAPSPMRSPSMRGTSSSASS